MAEDALMEADRLEITVLTDNYTDLLMIQSTDVAKRPQVPPPNALLAEHGLSCLVKVIAGNEEHRVLMDAGISPACLFHNARMLRKDMTRIGSVVLSHGHFDHFGGLMEFLNHAGTGISLCLHPDAFLERRMIIPSVGPVGLPGLNEAALTASGAVLQKTTGPSVIAGGLLLLTGEVEWVTQFEKGFPWAEAKVDGKWTSDPFHDDQGMVVSIKGKGLVILSGCAHAGIINTVQYAKKVSGMGKVHAIPGGFHLTGPLVDPMIQPTIDAMKKIGPDYIVPLHCTGWNAIHRFSAQMPRQFILNTVGTTYVF